jgi:serine/threonine protein kinase
MSFELKKDTIISHYKIIKKIGSGGMGIVYKAEDTKLKRTVALKFLPPEFTRDGEAKKRFIHEARASATLDHPNICTVHEIGETDDGQMFMAMGYYEGQTIKDKIERRGEVTSPLPINDAIDMAIQIAEGLHEAHEKKIIHRDIKSANIILTDKSVAKILDFGLAKLKGKTKLTKDGTTLGTVDYMSPEQAAGENVDHRSDIWSLGVVLYEMVTGQVPFKGEYEQAIMYAIMNEDPEPVTGLRSGIAMELELIINKTLAKNPSERYQGTADLIVDLKKVKKDSKPEVSVAKRKTKPETVIKVPRKVLLIGSFLLIAILIIAGYLILKKKSVPELPPVVPGKKPSLAVLYFDNDSGDKTLDVWRAGLAKLLITDLSQSRYMDILPTDKLHSVLKQLKLTEVKNYTTEHLLEIGKRAEVNHVLTSSFIKMGDNFIITAQLKNLEIDEVVHAFKLTAKNGHNVYNMMDDLTRQIKVELKFTEEQLATDIDQSIIDVTTSNVEALKQYIEGEKLHHLGQQTKSLQFFHRAIELDPDFAMAHLMLGDRYLVLAKFEKSNYHRQKAYELRHRLPLRERFQIETRYYRDREQIKMGIEKLQEILKIYPDDANSRHYLAVIYWILGERDKAIEQYKMIQNKTYIHYWALSQNYLMQKDYQKAHQTWDDYLKQSNDLTRYAQNMGMISIIERKFDMARQWFDKYVSSINNPEWRKKLAKIYQSVVELYRDHLSQPLKTWNEIQRKQPTKLITLVDIAAIHLIQGQFQKAFKPYTEIYTLCDQGLYKRTGRIDAMILSLEYQGRLYLRSKSFDKALISFSKAENLIPEPGIWSKWKHMEYKRKFVKWRALTFTEMGNLKEAESLLKELKSITPDVYTKIYPKSLPRMWILYLEGRMALKRGNFKEAINKLAQSVILLGGEPRPEPDLDEQHALLLYSLAEAYRLNGDIDKAIQTFKKVSLLTYGRDNFGDLYTRSFYQLGKLYQQQGNKEEAIKNYKKFIELWKDCDPIFQPMVKDAKTRLEQCRGRF